MNTSSLSARTLVSDGAFSVSNGNSILSAVGNRVVRSVLFDIPQTTAMSWGIVDPSGNTYQIGAYATGDLPSGRQLALVNQEIFVPAGHGIYVRTTATGTPAAGSVVVFHHAE